MNLHNRAVDHWATALTCMDKDISGLIIDSQSKYGKSNPPAYGPISNLISDL